MKRVIITGGNGFIGRYCISHLLKAGYEIHAISRNSRSSDSSVAWHTADLLNEDITHLIQRIKPTHLLHLAWVTEHGKFWTSPLNEQWAKVSQKLMHDFWASGGERFVVSGTCAEYEWTSGECKEGVTLEFPASLYGKSKKIFSDALAKYSDETGMSSACGRVFFLYGPGEPKTRLIPAVVTSLLNHEVVRCTEGSQIRDLMYVDDVAQSLVALLDSSVKGTVNIATGKPVKIREVITQLSQMVGSKEPKIEFGAVTRDASDPEVLTASTQRLNQEVGFSPETPLTEGLAKTIAWVETCL